MSTELKKRKTPKLNENIKELNSKSKSKEGKTKKKPIPIITGEDEDSKEDAKEEEYNYRYKTDTRSGKYKSNMRRVDKVKIMIRKEMVNEPVQKVDEDKNKKKDIIKEESISSWSVESVEVIK